MSQLKRNMSHTKLNQINKSFKKRTTHNPIIIILKKQGFYTI